MWAGVKGEFADPTTLLATGLVVRNGAEMPRGSPRAALQGGVTVVGVREGGRGWRAGLQEGDEVVRVHGKEVRSAEEVVAVVNIVPGPLEVVVRRFDQQLLLQL